MKKEPSPPTATMTTPTTVATPPAPASAAAFTANTKASPLLVVEALTVTYQEAATHQRVRSGWRLKTAKKKAEDTVLERFSLTLKKGELCCLLGSSGCGKTTLLKTLAGFLPITKGRITLGEKTLTTPQKRLPPDERDIGMVFQDRALFPHLSVEKNIYFGIKYGKRKLNDRAIKHRFEELVESFSLYRLLRKYPHELSGGESQRVALARAILPSPKLLLLDEPFASQDVHLKEKILDKLREVLKRERMTCLITTHDQLVGFKLSDRLGVIYKKHIAQLDTAYKLYHEPSSFCVAASVGSGVFLPASIEKNGRGRRVLKTEFGALSKYTVAPSKCVCCLPPGATLAGAFKEKPPSSAAARLLLRPDDVELEKWSAKKAVGSTGNGRRLAAVSGVVLSREFKGANYLYQVQLTPSSVALSLMPSHHTFAVGERVRVQFRLRHAIAFEK